MSDCPPTDNALGDGSKQQQHAQNSGRELPINYPTPERKGSTRTMQMEREVLPLIVPVDIRLRDEDVLNDDNWRTWKIRILHLLSINDLHKYPLSLVKKPSRRREPDEYATWEALDQSAFSIIFNNISSSQCHRIPGILGTELLTSAQIWESLCQVHEPPLSLCTSTMELRRLYITRAGEHSDMAKHLVDMQTLRLRLSDVDHHLRDDEFFNNLLITSLPESWYNFAITVFGVPGVPNGKQISTVQVISVLMSEYRRRTAYLKVDQLDGTQVNPPNKRKRNEELCAICRKANHTTDDCHWKQKGGYCTRCKHGGHWTRDCRVKGKGKRQANDSGTIVQVEAAPMGSDNDDNFQEVCVSAFRVLSD